MSGALAVMHLNLAYRFPRILSWVPKRRLKQLRREASSKTLVLSRDEARFHAWLGQNVPASERESYGFLSSTADLDGFRGRVLILSGGWGRKDLSELVEAIEPRVQCGAVRWGSA